MPPRQRHPMQIAWYRRAAERVLVHPRIVGVIALLLAITYIALTNDVATQGYRLQTMQRQATELQKVNEGMMARLTVAQSLQRVESELPALSLVAVQNIQYLAPITTAVAVR